MKSTREVRLCRYTHGRGWVPVKEGVASLSNRELEVMKLLALGVPSTEIGKKLFLSVKTIATYRERIFEKLNLTTLPELIHYALHHNVVKNLNEPKKNVLHLPVASRSYSMR